MKRHKMAWFDVPVTDMARAKAFYEAVVAWPVKEEYPGVGVFDHDDSITGGCLFLSTEVSPSPSGALLYYNVTGRHEEAQNLVAQHGGTVLTPRHPIGPFGYRTLALDSEGNRIALHSETAVA